MAFLTAQELAAELKVTVDTVWRYTRTARIPSIRLGPRDYRYSLPEVIDALTQDGRLPRTSEPTAGSSALRPADPLSLRSFANKLRGGRP